MQQHLLGQYVGYIAEILGKAIYITNIVYEPNSRHYQGQPRTFMIMCTFMLLWQTLGHDLVLTCKNWSNNMGTCKINNIQ